MIWRRLRIAALTGFGLLAVTCGVVLITGGQARSTPRRSLSAQGMLAPGRIRRALHQLTGRVGTHVSLFEVAIDTHGLNLAYVKNDSIGGFGATLHRDRWIAARRVAPGQAVLGVPFPLRDPAVFAGGPITDTLPLALLRPNEPELLLQRITAKLALSAIPGNAIVTLSTDGWMIIGSSDRHTFVFKADRQGRRLRMLAGVSG